MFNTNKKLKNEINRLKEELRIIKMQSQYCNLPKDQPSYMAGFARTETLTASEIIRRFGELYDHLGIEREIIPATSETPRLAKKKKANNA